jgi:hypothetical protein
MTDPAHQDPDAIWQAWMRDLLTSAAARFGLTITGAPVFGWRERSIGAEATGPTDGRWLRVVTEHIQWAHGDYWTGNTDAAALHGITKPRVLDTAEWEEGPRRIRAEVMTLAPGWPCSPTDVLRSELRLPRDWWAELRRSLDTLAATPTRRTCVSPDELTGRISAQLGVSIDPDAASWATVHGDLHWANLHAPTFALLDWEAWGSGPAALDAATLYCYSLTAPATARLVFHEFRDQLESPAGTIAQLYAIARLLSRADKGDYPELVGPLRQHADTLMRR